jgi:N-acetylneuraminic acid mutarotase
MPIRHGLDPRAKRATKAVLARSLPAAIVVLTLAACGQSHQALPAALNSGSGFVAAGRNATGGGSWTLTGSLVTPRAGPMGVALANGKVIVAGGLDNKNHELASAELYDPKTASWSHTASMSLARFGSTMTLLQNHKVLVAGGETASGLAVSAELYNPATHRWSRTGSMGTARANHTATLLANGKVLVAGGFNQNMSAGITSAELYDPASGTWSTTGSMATARESHTASLLASGQVLVSGGNLDFLDGAVGSAETYDPQSGKWTTVGRMMTSRSSQVSITLGDGSVIVAGGEYGNSAGSNPLAMTDRFDPTTGKWSPVGDMQVAQGAIPHLAGRAFHTATTLPDGRVLVAGGFGYIADFTQTVILQTAEIFDPSSRTWTLTGSMNHARAQHVAVVLADGRTLVAGGYDFGPPLASSEIFSLGVHAGAAPSIAKTRPVREVATRRMRQAPRPSGILPSKRLTSDAVGMWTRTGSMHVGRAFQPATLLRNGQVLVEGCDAIGSGGKTAELYDPASGTWSMTGSMHVARCGHSAVLLGDGRVLVAGGSSDANVWSSMEIYSPTTGRWMLAGDLNSTRAQATLALLPTGAVLAPGGYAVNGIPRDSADVYQPKTHRSTATPSLNISRDDFTADVLQNGEVLVSGGFTQNSAFTPKTELYDPVANAWALTGAALGQPLVSVLLNDGTVLALDPSQRYDPAVAGWKKTAGQLNIDRINNTLTVLADGRVLTAGGCTAAPTCQLVLQSEVYDPASQTWALDASMNLARESHSATRLQDGRILVAGGFGSGFAQLTSAELYTPASKRPSRP